MRINEDRLARRLSALAAIGAHPDGGMERLAFTPADRAGRDHIAGCLRAMGLLPRVDPIGNLWAVRPAADGGANTPVMMGSHTDTVSRGGTLDGALGVLAGLEVLETLAENEVSTRLPLGLVSFVNEEGVRFMPDMMGSLFARGSLNMEGVRGICGTDGTTIGDNLDATGMAGTEPMDASQWTAFLELHIEQGPVLETRGSPVGIVTGVQGLRWLEVSVGGAANHAGTTPMAMRRDAGMVLASAIREARSLTQSCQGLRATVGRVSMTPNLINVIPGSCEFTLDLRHPEEARIDEAESTLRARIEAAAEEEGAAVGFRRAAVAPAVSFDSRVVQAVAESVDTLGLAAPHMISGAGHDAQILAAVCPAGMIFIRSEGGISHSPREHSDIADVMAGANVLLGAALRLAGALSPDP